MIKRLVLSLILLIPAMAFAQRFATVDLKAIRAELPEMNDVQAAVDATSKKYEEEFANLRAKFQKEFNDFQSLAADTPNSIKERRAQEIQELDIKMQQFISDSQRELEQLRKDLMSPVNDRIMQAIREVGREGGYSMVLDVDTPLFIEAVDVTPQVRLKLGIIK